MWVVLTSHKKSGRRLSRGDEDRSPQWWACGASRCIFRAPELRRQCHRGRSLCGSAGTVEDDPKPSSSRNQSRGGLALRPGMMVLPICGLLGAWSNPYLPLWRFQESRRLRLSAAAEALEFWSAVHLPRRRSTSGMRLILCGSSAGQIDLQQGCITIACPAQRCRRVFGSLFASGFHQTRRQNDLPSACRSALAGSSGSERPRFKLFEIRPRPRMRSQRKSANRPRNESK